MLDFLEKKLQKSIAKIKAKTLLNEVDIIEVTREIKMALLEADVNLMVVKSFIASIKKKIIGSEIIKKLNPSQQMIKIVKEELVNILGKKTQDVVITKKPHIIMMVGLQGSGKTTTTAKLVKYFMKKQNIKKPLMVAADVYRPAAIEQLITLGKEIQIDVFSEKTKTDPRNIVKKALLKAQDQDYDLIIIDTAGRLAIDEKLMKELIDLKKIANPKEIFFVVDALSGQDIINVATKFNDELELTGSIITKLDSNARGGAALSISKLLNVPIRFIGTGEKIANLDLFHPDRMADRILGMGDVLSLIEKTKEVIDEKTSKRMINRMMSSQFNLNDLMNQLKQMKKLGKMSSVIKMIPGLSNKISKEQFNQMEHKMNLYKIIISSMTTKERKNPKLLKLASRKERILKGSGRSASEYNKLINEFEKMSKQMKTLAKSIKDDNFNPNIFRTFKG